MGNCNVLGRRKFVDIVEAFPEATRYVLETLREVYISDAKATWEDLTPQQRLVLHQNESGPRMAALQEWMQGHLEKREVEQNSALGRAIRYLNRRWSRLTLFFGWKTCRSMLFSRPINRRGLEDYRCTFSIFS